MFETHHLPNIYSQIYQVYFGEPVQVYSIRNYYTEIIWNNHKSRQHYTCIVKVDWRSGRTILHLYREWVTNCANHSQTQMKVREIWQRMFKSRCQEGSQNMFYFGFSLKWIGISTVYNEKFCKIHLIKIWVNERMRHQNLLSGWRVRKERRVHEGKFSCWMWHHQMSSSLKKQKQSRIKSEIKFLSKETCGSILRIIFKIN